MWREVFFVNVSVYHLKYIPASFPSARRRWRNVRRIGVGRFYVSLVRLVYVSQTNDPAEHPADITLEWAECDWPSCENVAAELQPVITCAGEMKIETLVIW